MNSLSSTQGKFIGYCEENGVLKFDLIQGFELKSKRISPWFFQAGNLMQNAEGLTMLSKIYVDALLNNFGRDGKIDADVIYGPAYKGIPLASVIATEYYRQTGNNIGFASHRKEIKDHGEKGRDFGMNVSGKRCIGVDDVLTAGTAFRQGMEDIKNDGGQLVGFAVLLDRQEVTGGKDIPQEGQERISAVLDAQRTFGVRIVSSLNYHIIRQAIKEGKVGNSEIGNAMDEYFKNYGVIY